MMAQPMPEPEQVRAQVTELREYLTLLTEALQYCNPIETNVKEDPVASEFFHKCREGQYYLMSMIERSQDDDLVCTTALTCHRCRYYCCSSSYASSSSPPQPT